MQVGEFAAAVVAEDDGVGDGVSGTGNLLVGALGQAQGGILAAADPGQILARESEIDRGRGVVRSEERRVGKECRL